MAELLAGMPILPLLPNSQVRFEAINPSTGVAVTGVVVSLATIYATEGGADEVGGTVTSGPYMLVPGPGATAAAEPAKKIKIKGGL